MDLELETLQRAEAAYQRVARLTTRLFYELGEYLVIEVILHAPRRTSVNSASEEATYATMQLDDEIADRLRFNPKQVRQWLAKLQADRLVVGRRVETKAAADAITGIREASAAPDAASVRLFWGINYETFVDAVRYKINAMELGIAKEEDHAGMQQEYKCPKCGRTIDALGLTPAMLSPMGDALCDVCGSELEEVDNSAQTEVFERRRKSLRSELRELVLALDEAEEFEPPRFLFPAADGTGAGGAKAVDIAGKGANGSASGAGPSATRAEEASSILGGSKFAGINKQQPAGKSAVVPWMMTDAQAAAAAAETGSEAGTAQQEEDEARQRAWIQAFVESRKHEEAPTMPPAGQKRSAPGAAVHSVTGACVDGPLAKRPAHSSSSTSAAPRRAQPAQESSEGGAAAAHRAEDSPTQGDEREEEEEEGEEEVMVHVQGVPKPLSAITEEDQERMTPEEHEQFLQIYHTQSGIW